MLSARDVRARTRAAHRHHVSTSSPREAKQVHAVTGNRRMFNENASGDDAEPKALLASDRNKIDVCLLSRQFIRLSTIWQVKFP